MGSRCAWTTADGGHCANDGRVYDDGAPVSLCRLHWSRLQNWALAFRLAEADTTQRRTHEQLLDETLQVVLLRLERHRLLTQAADDLDLVHHVYVVQRGDDLIKIGTTAQVRQRLGALRSAHGPLRVLAVVAGSYDEEAALHRRFADHLAEGREWFRPDRELLDWVDDIAASDLALPLG